MKFRERLQTDQFRRSYTGALLGLLIGIVLFVGKV